MSIHIRFPVPRRYLKAPAIVLFAFLIGGSNQLLQANLPPESSATASIVVTEGSELRVRLDDRFNDPDGDELSYSLISVARASIPTRGDDSFAWVRVNEEQGILELTPDSGDVGTYNVSLRASDEENSAVTSTVGVIVQAREVTPVVLPDEDDEGGAARPEIVPGAQKREIAMAKKSLEKAEEHRNFQLENPAHPGIGNARRLEALSLLAAWRRGDESRRERLEEVVATVRGDPSLPVAARAKVAANADFLRVEKADHASHAARIKALANTAKSIASEFPEWKTGHESLVGLARTSDPETARELIAQAKNNPHASEEIKRLATEAESRLGLIGKPLDSLLRPADSVALESLPDGSPVLIYSWEPTDYLSMQKAALLARQLSPDVSFLGVCLDGEDIALSREAANAAELPGLQLFDDASETLAGNLLMDGPGMGYLADPNGDIAAVSLRWGTMDELGILAD